MGEIWERGRREELMEGRRQEGRQGRRGREGGRDEWIEHSDIALIQLL